MSIRDKNSQLTINNLQSKPPEIAPQFLGVSRLKLFCWWSGIFCSPSLTKFHDPGSVVLPTGKTYLRLASVSKNLKQLRFFLLVRPEGLSPYRSSTGFPFFHHQNDSKIWENLFESHKASLCWCARRDSNPRPDEYKSSALPTELQARIKILAYSLKQASSTQNGFYPWPDVLDVF